MFMLFFKYLNIFIIAVLTSFSADSIYRTNPCLLTDFILVMGYVSLLCGMSDDFLNWIMDIMNGMLLNVWIFFFFLPDSIFEVHLSTCLFVCFVFFRECFYFYFFN